MRVRKIITANAQLEVFEFNTKGEDTLILIHGGPGISFYMHEVAELLSRKFRVLCFNQRGVGNSHPFDNSFTLSDYLNDIKEIANYYNLKTYHLLGHAWGGLLAQYYSHLYPANVKSLFLCNSFIGTGEQWHLMEAEIIENLIDDLNTLQKIYTGIILFLMRTNQFPRFTLKKLVDIILSRYGDIKKKRADVTKLNIKTYPKVTIATRRNILNTQADITLNAPKIPVLIMNSLNDLIKENRWRLEENWPEAQLVKLEQCGHLPWIDGEPDFNRIIQTYYSIR